MKIIRENAVNSIPEAGGWKTGALYEWNRIIVAYNK